MKTLELIEYDVWGNATEGFNVNQAFRTGAFYYLDENLSDRGIINSLRKQGLIKKGIHYTSIDIEGDFESTLYFTDSRTGMPDFELEIID